MDSNIALITTNLNEKGKIQRLSDGIQKDYSCCTHLTKIKLSYCKHVKKHRKIKNNENMI